MYDPFIPLTAAEREEAKKVCPRDLGRLEELEEALAELRSQPDGTVDMAADRMEQPE
jgi:hypothetical protein